MSKSDVKRDVHKWRPKVLSNSDIQRLGSKVLFKSDVQK